MLYPDFPGMGSGSQFSTELVNLTPELLTEADLLSVRRASADRAIEEMARRIGERLDVLRGRESRPDVVVVSLPREFETAMRRTGGTPKRRRRDPQIEKALRSLAADRRARQGHLFDLAPTIGRDGASSPPASLHRALKIEAMRMRVPVQVVWESTLSADGGKQDDATIAWNLAVGLYYKAGGVPWRLSGIDEDTCYVGVAFFRPTGMSSTLGCSVAQAFSQHGDGIVLRGDPFQWTAYGPPDLGREASRKLLASVLDMYASSTRRKPKRVVIHKSSRVTDAEYAGFVEALGDIPFHDFLALKTSDLRFLRTGREPPLRGTVVCLDEAIGRAVVYTRGYIPFLGIYPGQRVPLPIEICEQRGNGSLRQVTSELLALTKMNWNSADFACAEPITLAFARNVGHILADFPSGETPEPSYRYYM
ncbi:MAG: hypothetical protein JNM10_02040 [Planctomycetia bacterium]|nr:hypothetical protein [Planctomycetia bacterium]